MKAIRFFFLALFVLFISFSSLASAQDIKSGTWTGDVLMPDGRQMDIEFIVVSDTDSLSIDVVAPAFGSLPFSDINVSDSELTFTFRPGPLVYCDLSKNANGSYEGTCAPEGEDEALMTMNPPKDTN